MSRRSVPLPDVRARISELRAAGVRVRDAVRQASDEHDTALFVREEAAHAEATGEPMDPAAAAWLREH
jgi:hypothetical protein